MKLSATVKNFIEKEIEYIEAEDWRHVLTDWYLLSSTLVDEYKNWNELVFTMAVAGINFLKDSYDARMLIMTGVIPSIIAKRFQLDKSLSMKDILTDLNSLLGLTEDDLEDIIISELQKYH